MEIDVIDMGDPVSAAWREALILNFVATNQIEPDNRPDNNSFWSDTICGNAYYLQNLIPFCRLRHY